MSLLIMVVSIVCLMFTFFSFNAFADDWIIPDPPGTVKPIEALSCNNVDGANQKICNYLAEKITDKLNEKGISLNNGDLLYSTNVIKRDIPTGHSCSHTIDADGGYLDFYLKQDMKLGVEMDSLDVPLIAYSELPIDIKGRVDVDDMLGYQEVFGHGCNVYSHDHYNATVNELSTTVLFATSFSLYPTYEYLGDKKYRVAISPKIHLEMDVKDTELHWEYHDTNTVHQWFVTVYEFYSFIKEVGKSLLTWDSDEEFTLTDEAVVDLIYFGTNGILKPLDVLFEDENIIAEIWNLFHKEDEEINTANANEKLDQFIRKAEENLSQQISENLGLDENGQLSWTIDLGQLEHDVNIQKFRTIQSSLLIIEE